MSSNMSPFTDVESNGNKSRTPSSKPKKEKHLIAAVVILAIILFAFIIAVIILALKPTKQPSSVETCATEGCLSAALDLVQSMNTSVDPCEDFYEYACGNYYKIYTGPAQNRMNAAAMDNFVKMHGYLLNAVVDDNAPASAKKVGMAYALCSKYDDLTAEDKKWLLKTLQAVGGWPLAEKNWDDSRYHWESNLAQAIYSIGIDTPLWVVIDLDSFNTERYVIHVSQHQSNEIEPFNKEQILDIAKKIGTRTNDPTLEREYEDLVEFEQKLRKMSRLLGEIIDDPRETKVLTIKELSTAIPWVSWLEFLNTIVGPYLDTPLLPSEPIMIIGLDFISKFLELVFKENVPKRTLANYIAASFVRNLIAVNSDIAPTSLFRPTKHLYGRIVKADFPAGFSLGCLNFLSIKAAPAVDYLNYKSRKFDPVGDDMINYYFAAMKDMIRDADWLDEKTRTAAYEKLGTMKYYSGFSEIAKNDKLLDEYFIGFPNVTENALLNQVLIRRFRFMKDVQLLRKRTDKTKWPTMEGTHSSQLNAFYVPEYNGMVIPADIQVDPLISPKRPKYWNFGAFGWVLGHEVTHGFDTAGSNKDKYGNIRNWWMPKAREEFNNRAKCLIEQYSKIPYGYKNYHVNGTQTVGENVADNGGLRQTYLAYKKWEKDHGKEKVLPGFEKFSIDQLFFLSVAQTYCSVKILPEVLYQTHHQDYHSPTNLRFNPAAANFDAFGKAFKCKSGTPMNPVKKCVVW